MAEIFGGVAKKCLVLAGAGDYGKRWLEKLWHEGIEVLFFLDKDKEKIGKELCGKKILDYSKLKDMPEANIFITVANEETKKEIEEMILGMGCGGQIIDNPLYTDNKISADSHIYNSYLEGKNLILEKVELINSYLGRCSYISAESKIVSAKIGKYTCIGPDVKIVIGQHPTTDIVSVHPAFYSIDNEIGYSFVKANKFKETKKTDQGYAVVVGNDVWIGMGSRIMEGVTIADGSIIAAGAMVVRDTKPFELVGGVPARHIKYRFNENEREKLLKIRWWDKGDEWIQAHAEEFGDIKSFYNMECL